MDATSHPDHQHADHGEHGSTDGVNAMALSATLHCLTGCAVGEILGLGADEIADLENDGVI